MIHGCELERLLAEVFRGVADSFVGLIVLYGVNAMQDAMMQSTATTPLPTPCGQVQ